MTTGGFSSKRLALVRDMLERHVDAGYVPGAVAVVPVTARSTSRLAFVGACSRTPMAADTICRIGSTTKPIVAACAMTLVEDCTLRLDDPVDEFLPERAEGSAGLCSGKPIRELLQGTTIINALHVRALVRWSRLSESNR